MGREMPYALAQLLQGGTGGWHGAATVIGSNSAPASADWREGDGGGTIADKITGNTHVSAGGAAKEERVKRAARAKSASSRPDGVHQAHSSGVRTATAFGRRSCSSHNGPWPLGRPSETTLHAAISGRACSPGTGGNCNGEGI